MFTHTPMGVLENKVVNVRAEQWRVLLGVYISKLMDPYLIGLNVD